MISAHKLLVFYKIMEANVIEASNTVKLSSDKVGETSPAVGAAVAPGKDNTFHQTQVDFTEEENLELQVEQALNSKVLRFPNGYDVVAVRETLLGEAGFVTQSTRGFWRRLMDTEEFVGCVRNMYHHLLGCFSESGVLYMENLADIHESHLIEDMSNHFANIYFGISRSERDIFLPKLPELLLFMVVNALQAALPKHQRIYMSCKFREILLDWCGELFCGMRASNSRVGRDWLFADCNEMSIVTAERKNKFVRSLDMTLDRREKTARFPISTTRIYYNFEHSPLIGMYIARNNRGALQIKNKMCVTLSHIPHRPLVTLQDGLIKTVRVRERYTEDKKVKQTIRRGHDKRREIMETYEKGRSSYKRDTARIRDALKFRMNELSGKKLSKKEEYLAQSATLGGEEFKA